MSWVADAATSSSGALAAGSSTITLTAPSGTVFPLSASDYTVVTNGALGVLSATPTQTAPNNVTITVPISVADGTNFQVNAQGVTNPAAGTYPPTDFSVSTSSDLAPVNPTSGVAFTSSVSGVGFSASNIAGGATSVTWDVGATTSSSGALAAGSGTITLTGPSGTVFPLTASDYVLGQGGGGTTVSATPTQTAPNNVTVTVPVSLGNSTSFHVTVQGVTNPSAGSYPSTDFAVSTSADMSSANPSSGITFNSSVSRVSFSPNSFMEDASTTWTVGFTTSTQGSLTNGDTITITAPSGTVFPSAASDYAIQYGSSTTGAIPTVLNGGAFVRLDIYSPATVNIPSSTAVRVTISGVTNPPAGAYGALFFSVFTSKDRNSVSPSSGLTFISPDGTGTMVATTAYASSGSTGNTLVFTYTAANAITNGAVAITVPSGWSAPSTTGTSPGFVTASQGSVAISGQQVIVSGVTLNTGQTMNIDYGAKGSGGPGATAPTGQGTTTFSTQEKSSGSGTLTALATSPVLTLTAPVGSGTLTVTPSTAVAGSTGHTLTFTYTAAGTIPNLYLNIQLPAGWSPPSLTPTAPGYITAFKGEYLSVSGNSMAVLLGPSGLSLSSGQSVVLVYGSTIGGGTGATAPTQAGSVTPLTLERWAGSGPVVPVSAAPSLTVLPGAAAGVALTPTTSTVALGGQNTVTASVYDRYGNAVPGTELALTTTGGQLAHANVTTSVYGTAGDSLTAPTVPGTVTVTATAGPLSGSTAILVESGNPSSVSMSAQGSPVPGQTLTFNGVVKDRYGNALPNVTLYLTSTSGTLGRDVVTSGSTGTFTDTILLPTAAGTVTVMAHLEGLAGGTLNIPVSPGAPARVVLSLLPSSVPAGGAVSVTGAVYDQYGNPLPGIPIQLAAGTGTFSPSAPVTVAGGIFGAILTAPAQAGPVAVTATAGGISSQALLSVVPGRPGSLLLSVSPLSVPVNGAATVSGVVRDVYGNPVAGAQVSFVLSRDSAGLAVGGIAQTVTTATYGTFSTLLQAPAISGAVTVTGAVYGALARGVLIVTPANTSVTGTGTAQVNGCDNAAAQTGQTSETACGTGSLVVAQYGGDPGGTTPAEQAVAYFDAAISASSNFSSVGIRECAAQAGDQLAWWNPAIPGWAPVSPAATYGAGCLSFTATGSSSPAIGDLGGTVFVVTSTPSQTTTTQTSGGSVPIATTGPQVSTVSPSSGSAGSTITLTGAGMTTTTQVLFGTVPATSFHMVSDTEVTAVVPAGTGKVLVTVRLADGNVSPGVPFTYQATCTASFPDVPSGYWAYTAIHALACAGIVNGFPDGQFQPNGPVTRAQFAKMLVEVTGLKPGGASGFADVSASAWYGPYVAAAARAGLVKGETATTFVPGASITREQAAALLVRVLRYKKAGSARGAAPTFTDQAQVSGWAVRDVASAVGYGLLHGFPNGTIQPLATVTRAQAAVMIDRLVLDIGQTGVSSAA